MKLFVRRDGGKVRMLRALASPGEGWTECPREPDIEQERVDVDDQGVVSYKPRVRDEPSQPQLTQDELKAARVLLAKEKS